MSSADGDPLWTQVGLDDVNEKSLHGVNTYLQSIGERVLVNRVITRLLLLAQCEVCFPAMA
jgi:hypothetical protein